MGAYLSYIKHLLSPHSNISCGLPLCVWIKKNSQRSQRNMTYHNKIVLQCSLFILMCRIGVIIRFNWLYCILNSVNWRRKTRISIAWCGSHVITRFFLAWGARVCQMGTYLSYIKHVLSPHNGINRAKPACVLVRNISHLSRLEMSYCSRVAFLFTLICFLPLNFHRHLHSTVAYDTLVEYKNITIRQTQSHISWLRNLILMFFSYSTKSKTNKKDMTISKWIYCIMHYVYR